MPNTSKGQVPWRWRKLLGIERTYWLITFSVALTIGAVCGVGIVVSSWSISFAVSMTVGMFAVPIVLIGIYKLFSGNDTKP